jgi:hypothetical protein
MKMNRQTHTKCTAIVLVYLCFCNQIGLCDGAGMLELVHIFFDDA